MGLWDRMDNPCNPMIPWDRGGWDGQFTAFLDSPLESNTYAPLEPGLIACSVIII